MHRYPNGGIIIHDNDTLNRQNKHGTHHTLPSILTNYNLSTIIGITTDGNPLSQLLAHNNRTRQYTTIELDDIYNTTD